MPGRVRTLLHLGISLGLFLLPATIVTLISGRTFHSRFLYFLDLVLTFSAAPYIALFSLRLPRWLGTPPALYLINLIPIAFFAAAGYLLLRRSPKVSQANAAWIAVNGSILLVQSLGSLMLYFFARYSGP